MWFTVDCSFFVFPVFSVSSDGTEMFLHEVHAPGVLNCYELRGFWVALTSDYQWQLGHGYPAYEDPIFTYSDIGYDPVHGVAFASYDRDGEVQYHDWEYGQDAGPITIFNTGTSLTYNQFWMDRYNDEYRTFRVKACSDVHIVLSTYMGTFECLFS